MPRRTRRGQVVGMVEGRVKVAERMGSELFHPAMSATEAVRTLRSFTSLPPTDAEIDALDCLMPATFLAAFTRGWTRAEATAHLA